MMGRRRKKIIKLPKKTIPKIFLCPACGEKSINVRMNRNTSIAQIICSNCEIEVEVPLISADQPVDAYCKFTDRFYTENVVRG